MRVAAVVLAAGRSSRYRASGGAAPTKLVAPFRGEALVRHPIKAALLAGLSPCVVVTGHEAAGVRDALAGFDLAFAHNPDFASGLASSLRVGLGALDADIEAAFILLGDMPLVDAATLRTLLDCAAANPTADAVLPVTEGERGNPVLLRRVLFAAAAELPGDAGARRLLRRPGIVVTEVPIAGRAVRLDVDDAAGFGGRE